MNTGFLARQLILTELLGEAVDFKGGCLVMGQDIWAGIWEPKLIKDPEEYITAAQTQAEEYGRQLKGMVMLIPGAMEKDASVVALTEALYIYGYPRCEDKTSGPEMVQVLSRPPKTPALSTLEFKVIKGADRMLTQAKEIPETMYSEWSEAEYGLLRKADITLASISDEPVGLIAAAESDLTSRIVLLWVAEEHRKQGIGRSMLTNCIAKSQADGKLLISAWTYRTGSWRYYLKKVGFEEQLSAVYFKHED